MIKHFPKCPYLDNSGVCNCGALLVIRKAPPKPYKAPPALSDGKLVRCGKKWKVFFKGDCYGIFKKREAQTKLKELRNEYKNT